MEARSRIVACNMCGSDKWTRIYHRAASPALTALSARMTTDIYSGYGQIVRCLGCGLVYTNPRWDDADIQTAYRDMADEDYLEERNCRCMNAHLSLQTVENHVKKGRLLDIGCSTGFFLNAARMDFEPYGIEPSRWAADYAKNQLRLPSIEPDLYAARYPDGHFDVVTMNDVIEHVTDPLGLLREAARVTKKGGLLYVVTPNIESLSARLLRGWWWGLRPAHIFYFSPKTLSAMLEKAGFEVAECRSYGRIFTYGYWLSRLRNYPAFFYRLLRGFIDLLGWQQKVVYVNTRDSIEICAIKK